MPQTLSTRQLNRALLARQMLLTRVRRPLPRVVERIGGIQAQYAPSAYVALWSRVEGFSRADLTRALERRSVIQGTLLRSTIHIVSRPDYWIHANASRAARREWWERIARGRGLDDVDMVAIATAAREALAAGPLDRNILIDTLEAAGFPRDAFEGLDAWIDMVRVPPSGTWDKRRASLYGDAEEWVGPADVVSASDASRELLRRYLAAFGPAAVADAARWAGVPTATMEEAAERLTLRRFEDDEGRGLLDLPRAPLPPPDTPAPIRLLGTWDAMLLTHARDKGVLAEDHRPIVFSTKNPPSVNTFLVDGTVAGSWRYEPKGGIDITPYGPLPTRARRELDEETSRIRALYEA
jgi:hypothetical protein